MATAYVPARNTGERSKEVLQNGSRAGQCEIPHFETMQSFAEQSGGTNMQLIGLLRCASFDWVTTNANIRTPGKAVITTAGSTCRDTKDVVQHTDSKKAVTHDPGRGGDH